MEYRDYNLDSAGLAGEFPILGTIPVFTSRPERGATLFAQSGLAAGVLIDSENGPVSAREIRPGLGVVTRANGIRPVLWAGLSRNVQPLSGEMPVRIRRGALTPDGTAPAQSILCAPGQKLLLRHPLNELLFGAAEVLVRAADLLHLDGVEMVTRSDFTWVHLLFERHEVIRAQGQWVETLRPDMEMIARADPFALEDIHEAVPRLRYNHGMSAYLYHYPVLNRREAELLDI